MTGSEYEFLEEYINGDTPIKVSHVDCGSAYKVAPKEFLNNMARCPVCKGFGAPRKSLPSKILESTVSGMGFDTLLEYRFKDLPRKPFDVFVPELKLCIEYDGEQHFRPKFGEDHLALQKQWDYEKNCFMHSMEEYSFIRVSFLDRKKTKEIAEGIVRERSTTIERNCLYHSFAGELSNEIAYYTKHDSGYFE